MSVARRILAVIIGVIWLEACQSATVSVDQALRITEGAAAPSVSLSPSIDDVFALLEHGPAPEWRERMASDRALAEQVPRPGLSPSESARFYYRRGLAAQNVGRARQQLEDLGQAVELGRRGGFDKLDFMVSALGFAEQSVGRYSRHPALRQEALDRTAQPGARLVWNMVLAEHQAALGDFRGAEAAVARAAADLSCADCDPDWSRPDRARYLFGRAAVARAQSRPQEAEGFARQAVAELDVVPEIRGTNKWGSTHIIEDAWKSRLRNAHQELSMVLSAQGRVREAEVEALKALRLPTMRYGRDHVETALALLPVADVLLQQGRSEDGERVAREAVAIFDRIGAAPEARGRALARREVAMALALRERWSDALAEFETIERDMQADRETLEQFFWRDPDWALVLVRSGRALEAVERLGPAVGPLQAHPTARSMRVAETRGMLGIALAATGDHDGALRELRASLPVLLGSPVGDHEQGLVPRREWRLRGVLEAYIDMLSRWPSREGIEEGFRLADAARGQSVQRAVGAGAARGAAKDPALADLVRRAQDAERLTAGLYRQLADLSVRPKDATNRQDTRPTADIVHAQIEALDKARATLTEEIRRQFPAYAEITDPQPITLEEAQAALGKDEALVAVLVGHERTWVWGVPKTGPPEFATAVLPSAEISALATRLRRSVTPVNGTLSQQPAFDTDAAHQLYAALLLPVEASWRGARRLIVVPHALLGQLPFGMLLTAPVRSVSDTGLPFSGYRVLPFLIRQTAVTQLPSVASVKILRAAQPTRLAPRPFVGFGDPWFSAKQVDRPEARGGIVGRSGVVGVRSGVGPGHGPFRVADLPPLPDTGDEIIALGQALGADLETDVFLGRRANVQAVKSSDLSRYRVVAFATHGLTPGALEGLTQPALALSAPEVAGVDGDGLLTMEDILGLKLTAQWVVLSACDTAAAAGAGAEAVSGLGRAFLYAGTQAVLVTHWSVETTSARALTTELFQRQRADVRMTRAEALREAQLALIEGAGFVDPRTERAVYSYAHPMFWAPFALVGDGGGTTP